MLIRKNVYIKLGGLQEDLEFYGEEPEFCWRLRENHYETWVVPNSTIVHYGGGSSGGALSIDFMNVERKLYRYAQLQKYTVGYKHAILFSRIVILGCKIKRLMSFDTTKKHNFTQFIIFERLVIEYLKKRLNN